MSTPGRLAFGSPLLLMFAACGPSPQGGQLAAKSRGAISDTPVVRSPALEAFTRECGAGDLTERGDAVLERLPYLQRTTPNSTRVVFTAELEGEAIVDVTTPRGEVVASVPVVADPGAPDARQWLADIEGLQSDTLYCYSLRGLTEPQGLRTAPDPDGGKPVRFVVLGDSGSGDERQYAVLEQIETVPFDLMLHTGDVAYESGKLRELESNFFDVYDGLLSSIPAFPTSGNHDYQTQGGAPFRAVFSLPENGGPEGLERWFSFDWGDVHFVALDTEMPAAAQSAWLERDLANNSLPWTIVYLHRPPFSSGEHGSNLGVRDTYVPLFERYGVDLVFAGHDHHYERTNVMGGVTYIVTGAGGRGTRGTGHSSFTAFAESVLHFVYVEVHGAELRLHAIDATGVEFDAMLIERS